jgi:hypothetical protein
LWWNFFIWYIISVIRQNHIWWSHNSFYLRNGLVWHTYMGWNFSKNNLFGYPNLDCPLPLFLFGLNLCSWRLLQLPTSFFPLPHLHLNSVDINVHITCHVCHCGQCPTTPFWCELPSADHCYNYCDTNFLPLGMKGALATCISMGWSGNSLFHASFGVFHHYTITVNINF